MSYALAMAVAALEIQDIRDRVLPIGVALYHSLYGTGEIKEPVELFEGVIVEKMPKPPLHSALVAKLVRFLRAHLPENLDVRQEQPLTFTKSELEPDVAVVHRREDDYIEGHPTTAEFVVEVAVSSAEYDRKKAAVYAAAGVREYWLVDADANIIEVYRNPEGDGYRDRESFRFSDALAVPGNGTVVLADL